MRKFITLTQILPCFFMGGIVGGIISKRVGLIILCVILLIVDIIVGITLQYFFEKGIDNRFKKTILTVGEADKILYEAKNKTTDADLDDDIYADKPINSQTVTRNKNAVVYINNEYYLERIGSIISELKQEGGGRIVHGIATDDTGIFLIDLFSDMPMSPDRDSLFGMNFVSVEEIGETPSLFYSFMHKKSTLCDTALIVLTHIKNLGIRVFVVETSIDCYCLCEYAGRSHKNYGRVELSEVPYKIQEIISGV